MSVPSLYRHRLPRFLYRGDINGIRVVWRTLAFHRLVHDAKKQGVPYERLKEVTEHFSYLLARRLKGKDVRIVSGPHTFSVAQYTGTRQVDKDHISVTVRGGPHIRTTSHIYLKGHGVGSKKYDNISVEGECVFYKESQSPRYKYGRSTIALDLCRGEWNFARRSREDLIAKLVMEEKALAEEKKFAGNDLTADDMEFGTGAMPTKTSMGQTPSVSDRDKGRARPRTSNADREHKFTKELRREGTGVSDLRKWERSHHPEANIGYLKRTIWRNMPKSSAVRRRGKAHVKTRKWEDDRETVSKKAPRGIYEPLRAGYTKTNTGLNARDTWPIGRQRAKAGETIRKSRIQDAPMGTRKKPNKSKKKIENAVRKARQEVLETLRKESPDSEANETPAARLLGGLRKGHSSKSRYSKAGKENIISMMRADVHKDPPAHSARMKQYREDLQKGWRSHDWYKRTDAMAANGTDTGIFEAILKAKVRS